MFEVIKKRLDSCPEVSSAAIIRGYESLLKYSADCAWSDCLVTLSAVCSQHAGLSHFILGSIM